MTIIDVSRHNGPIDWQRVKAAGVTRATIRSTMGATGIDERFASNWRGSAEAGIAQRGVYHYVVTGVPAAAQVANILAVTHGEFGNTSPAVDAERTEIERVRMAAGWVFPKVAYTAMLHDICFSLKAQAGQVEIYTSRVEWMAITTEPDWALEFLHWIAQYNSHVTKPDCPPGWDWDLWQYTSMGRVDGIAGNVDMSRGKVQPVTNYRPQPNGTLYGMHAEQSSQTIPLMQRAKDAGVAYRCLLAMENPGLCVDAKAIFGDDILTIARWENPNKRWEGGQDVAIWPDAERLDFARQSIQLIFDRTNDTEYAASDYFCPGLNEWDPPEIDGWRNAAQVWLVLMDEAERRSPEMTAKGLHPIRLAIPGMAQGTPEYREMVAVKNTGLFERMKQRGDILLGHEGVFFNQPIDTGFGDLIPGAPSVPPNAGSACGRINYWYSLGIEVPFVSSEWYDGNWRTVPPAVRLQALQWYDRVLRQNKWYRGLCAFELTDDMESTWWGVDFTPTFQSQIMLDDMISEKDKPNGADMNLTQILADATIARDASQRIINEVDQTNQLPLYQARVLIAVNVRDTAGVATGAVLTVGTITPVYAEHIQAGSYSDRAKINPDGSNVVMTSGGQPTLQRL